MSAYAELNIKVGMPLAADALAYLKNALERLRKDRCKCVLVIHGYGSTGKGGVIHDKARQWLKAQERSNKLKSVIFGEDFEIFNFKSLELKNRYPELSALLGAYNHGVTVVEL